VKRAIAVIDRVTLTQGVKTISLTRVFASSELEAVCDFTERTEPLRLRIGYLKL
jgi:hypothetical protein